MLKRKNIWTTPSSSGYFSNPSPKRSKICHSPTYSPVNNPGLAQSNATSRNLQINKKIHEDIGLPNEIMLHLFKYLSREELDSCGLVCKRWLEIIEKHESKLSRRNVRILKIFESGSNTGTITISATTNSKNLKYNLIFGDQHS